jgi:hypothetical protein
MVPSSTLNFIFFSIFYASVDIDNVVYPDVVFLQGNIEIFKVM